MRTGEDGLAPGEAVELLREKEQLEHAMESRPVIDMARGVLLAGSPASRRRRGRSW